MRKRKGKLRIGRGYERMGKVRGRLREISDRVRFWRTDHRFIKSFRKGNIFLEKTLVLINGSLGVGKTTIAEQLFYSIENSGWLDADQVWWSMKQNENFDEIFPVILDNSIHCLNNYFNYGLNPVIISWFFPKTSQIKFLCDNLSTNIKLLHIMLTAKKSILEDRHRKRGDRRPYASWMFVDESQLLPQTNVIDTSNLNVEKVVQIINTFYDESTSINPKRI